VPSPSDRVDRPTLIDVAEARTGVPRAIPPMHPRLALRAFNSPEYFFELKWDGIRALLSRDHTGVHLRDRAGGDLLPAVPELRDARIPEGIVLDGEIVVCDSRGRPSYDLLAGRIGPKAAKRGRGPVFVAFDLLHHDGRPLLTKTLADRRTRLLAAGLSSRLVAVPEHLEHDGEPFLEVVAEYGLEGIVAKRREGAYVPGARSAEWLKCYVTPRADIIVGGLLVDDRRGARAVLCGARLDDGAVAFVGEAHVPPYLGAWLDDATRGFATDASPFATPVALRPGIRFLRPRLVAIVEHGGVDADGELRDARFRALRLDGRPDDARREVPVDVPSAPAHVGPERPRLVVLHSLPFGLDRT
jgi:bifunctional non-homologous end joining protein LigD